MFGFQSSNVVSKSSANRKHRPKNLPVDTSDPELHAVIFVFSNVITTAPRDSNSGFDLDGHFVYEKKNVNDFKPNTIIIILHQTYNW